MRFELVDNFMPASDIRRLIADADISSLHRVERDTTKPQAMDMGEPYSYSVATRSGMNSLLDQGMVDALYDRVLAYLKRTDANVIPSPYYESSMTLKAFHPLDRQGWHYDTNPVTALLYLTDCEGGYTEFTDGTRLAPAAGRLALFDGRNYLHRAAVVRTGTKVTIPLNYYLINDQYRPKEIEGVVYGGVV